MKKKTFIISFTMLAAIAVVAAVLFPSVIKPAIDRSKSYRQACSLLTDGSYSEAQAIFKELGQYRDSAVLVNEAQYEKAALLAARGNYEEAIELWTAIMDYSDSSDKIDTARADILERDYHLAISEMDAGNYETAMATFKSIGGYEESDTLYISASYGYARQLVDEEHYKEAIEIFDGIKGYENADDLKTDAIYLYACQLLEEGEYASSIAQFKKNPGYKDTDEKILDAKYGYVLERNHYKDATVYSYLQELIEAEYPEAQTVYDDLYAWKAEVYAINAGENDWANYTEISKFRIVYFFFKVSGGTPGAATELSAIAVFPSGSVTSGSLGTFADGDAGYIAVSYDAPEYAPAGTLNVTFYDGNNNQAGSSSIKLTD